MRHRILAGLMSVFVVFTNIGTVAFAEDETEQPEEIEETTEETIETVNETEETDSEYSEINSEETITEQSEEGSISDTEELISQEETASEDNGVTVAEEQEVSVAEETESEQDEETTVYKNDTEEVFIDSVVVQEAEYLSAGDGFVTTGGKTYFYSNGEKLTGLWQIDGKVYYFNQSGVMQKGWVEISGSWFYFKSNGAAEKGWKKWNGNMYYLDKQYGVMVSGELRTIDGKIYLFAKSGKQLKGWQQYSGKWYFFKADGAAEKGWKKWNGKWYFLDRKTAVMATGVKTIDGKIYGFNSSGAMLKGWQKFSGKWYFFKSNGAAEKGWKKWNGKWYFLDRKTAVMVTGVKTIDGKIYGFNSSGAMLRGWQKFGDKWYFFKSNGAAEKGWKKWNGKWYFLDRTTAVMVTGTKTIDGKTYKFNSSGQWINESIPTQFNSYYDVIKAYQNKYGAGKLVNHHYEGLWYAELVDFDRDGDAELVIGVNTATTIDAYIFGHVSGKVKQLAHPNINGAEGGAPDSIAYARDNEGNIIFYGYIYCKNIPNVGTYSIHYLYGYYKEDRQKRFMLLTEIWRELTTGKYIYKNESGNEISRGAAFIRMGEYEVIASYYPYNNWESRWLNGRSGNFDLSLTNNTINKVKNMGD